MAGLYCLTADMIAHTPHKKQTCTRLYLQPNADLRKLFRKSEQCTCKECIYVKQKYAYKDSLHQIWIIEKCTISPIHWHLQKRRKPSLPSQLSPKIYITKRCYSPDLDNLRAENLHYYVWLWKSFLVLWLSLKNVNKEMLSTRSRYSLNNTPSIAQLVTLFLSV